MTQETDLPCTDCGSALEERTEPLSDRASGSAGDVVTVATCTNCGARHYPERSLSRLSEVRRRGS